MKPQKTDFSCIYHIVPGTPGFFASGPLITEGILSNKINFRQANVGLELITFTPKCAEFNGES